MRTQDTNCTPHILRTIAWAKNRLAALEGRIAPEHIDKTLAEKRLSREPDDLVDPLGDPAEEPKWSW
jgi:hypothetical protein